MTGAEGERAEPARASCPSLCPSPSGPRLRHLDQVRAVQIERPEIGQGLGRVVAFDVAGSAPREPTRRGAFGFRRARVTDPAVSGSGAPAGTTTAWGAQGYAIAAFFFAKLMARAISTACNGSTLGDTSTR